jgi:hypothetical protein
MRKRKIRTKVSKTGGLFSLETRNRYGAYFCIRKNLRRNDLVGSKGLFGINEGYENLPRLAAFT